MDADVIVVGAGPVGLMLVHELALAGADVIVLDKEPGRTGQSRALNLYPRTAEVLDMRGMLANAEARSQTRLEATHFAHLPVPLSFDGWGSRYNYQVGIPQAEVEQVIEEKIGGLGVHVRWGAEVTAVEQDEERVRVEAGGEWLEARYLVGCDGGRSTVRKLLDVPFPGLDARTYGTVADVVLGPETGDIAKVWNTKGTLRRREDNSFANIFPIGSDVHRIFYGGGGRVITDQRAAVPDDEVIDVIHDYYGAEVDVKEVRWASRFSDASRQVEQYRIGRILLAGDAAHIHLPLGGQGLNLGVQDAMNLGWKLAAQVAGRAPDGLLDSYHAERHPIGATVIGNTRAQVAISQKDLEHEALRAMFVSLISVPEGNRMLGGTMAGLAIKYDLGRDEEPVGSRLADFQLADGTWASTLFHTGHGVLLTTRDEFAEQAAPWAASVDAVRVPVLPELGVDAVLVRPDGYICWAPGAPLEDALRRWFGSPA